MNMSAISVNTSNTLGEKCNGEMYTRHFQAAFNKIGEVNSVGEAIAKFNANYKQESAGYHTGSAGILKYSAPFLAAIRDAFAKQAESKAKK